MSLRFVVPFFFTLFVLHVPLLAQKSGDPHRHDLRIEQFLQRNQRDSFLFYSSEKLRLAREADSLALWGWTQIDLHDFRSEAGQEGEALKVLDAAWLQRWREPKNPEEWEPFLYVQQNRSWSLSQTGTIWQAVQVYESAAQLYEQFRYPDFEVVETIYKPLGNHYTRLGDNEKALVVFQKALAIGGDNEVLAGLYSNIGIAYWNQGDATQAIAYFRKGLDLKSVSNTKSALLQSSLAQATLDLRRSDRAQESHSAQEAYNIANQAIARLRFANPPDRPTLQYRAGARRTAGMAATALGRYLEAGQLLTDALSDAQKAFGSHSREVGKIEIARSELFRKQGQHRQAILAANRALNAVLPAFKPKKEEENPDAGTFYEENVIFEALQAKALAAEKLYHEGSNYDLLLLALDCHDLAWQAEMRLRKVQQYDSSKLDQQKSSRSRDASAMRIARMLFEKTGQEIYLKKAFAIAERSKANLLFDALRDNLLSRGAANGDRRPAQIASLRKSLSYFERSLLLDPSNAQSAQWRIEADALGNQITRLERELAADYPLLSNQYLSATDIWPAANDVRADETLLEYFVGDEFVDVFIFQGGQSPMWRRLANDVDLQGLVARFLSFFENGGAILDAPDAYLQTAHALWQKIMPLEVSTAPRLLIVPDGFLNFLPFEALVTQAPATSTTLRNAPYLIVKQEVRYAWSLAVLRQQNQLQSGATQYLLALAPGFANGERGLAPLLSGDSEWRSAGGNVLALRGRDADMQHFLAEADRYRILHFSSHAFSDDHPRIELYDRPLFLPDIYALSLRADLVVLSACQTGLGREQKGEGVMSLTRAFAEAGAACIISSLWSVNDRSTAQVLARFYQNLGEGNTACSALRQAKIAYISDSDVSATLQSPYFWAGLVPMGADRAIGNSGIRLHYAVFILSGTMVLLILTFSLYLIRHRKKSKKAGLGQI